MTLNGHSTLSAVGNPPPLHATPSPMDVALSYNDKAWAVFPCRSHSEEHVDPATGEIITLGEKAPLTPNGFKGATLNRPLIERMWTKYPDAAVGLPTGEKTGFFALDIDNKPGGANGFHWLAEMEAEHGPLPDTARVTSPNGGLHIYFKYVVGTRNRGALGAGVDIRSEGGYVLAAGSTMANGRSYKWETDTRDIADAPAWLLDLLLPKSAPAHTQYSLSAATNNAYVDAAVDRELADLAGAPMGSRNNALNDAAFSIGTIVGAGALGEAEARALLQDVARGWGRDWSRCCKTIENGLKAGIQNPRHIPEPDFLAHDNTPMMEQDAISRFIVNSVAKRLARLEEKVAANDNVPIGPVFSIFDWTVDRFKGEPPKVEYLVDGVMPAGVPGMVSAMGDTGKSYAMLELHRRVSFGSGAYDTPIFGGRVLARGTSVMITSEDDASEVHRRIAALDHKEHRFSELGRKMIVVPLPSAGGAQAFWKDDKKKGLQETDNYHRICDQLSEIDDLRLVTFDPLASFAHLPLNEDPAAGQFVCTSLSRLATETGATVLVAHHMRKTQKPIETLGDARDSIRGSTALVDGLRLAYAMWPAEEARARKVCKTVGVEFTPGRVVLGGVVKANGAARRVISTYVRNDHGLLVDKTALLGSATPPTGDLIGALVVTIEAAANAGAPFTKTGASGVFEMRERLPDELKALSKSRLHCLVDDALGKGMLVRAAAKGEKIAKWLDVPGGYFATGLGSFTTGSVRI
ncbi:bifunctional DNA primase/polymerase [Agrobacterium tumefaciens]|uniref:bifunctional DNA primase/polymerase n=1 Tax=Agrobacterium tumefaciens TaxID=358 RepID=UPI002AFE1E5B|nr:bifunctional DNA primase/polymerase [Agrobacterium tumefaciens]MEA1840702.1 bifunctional DNA primase/polymerase [Agrobacterium tumefaciens]